MDYSEIRQKYFPHATKSGYSIRVSNPQEVYSLYNKIVKDVFPSNGEEQRFLHPNDRQENSKALMKRYHDIHHEWFVFCDNNDNLIGWFMGEVDDHVTFYLRNTGIHPAHQSRGIYKEFAGLLETYLSDIGYEKLSSHHMVTNKKILILKLNMGFVISALELTEQWGPMVKMIKILAKDRRKSFFKQFGKFDHL